MATKPTPRTTTPEALAEALNQSQLRNYLEALPPEQRKFLKELRDTIVTAAPGAKDSFAYGAPEILLKDKPLFTYVAMKRHAKLSPLPERIDVAELKGFRTSKEGIQFPYSKALPKELIRQITKARLTEK
jgi:uncharacterized protein YdhG (YjbR/CyaY superfamily)